LPLCSLRCVASVVDLPIICGLLNAVRSISVPRPVVSRTASFCPAACYWPCGLL
jgi:hypothetical protein